MVIAGCAAGRSQRSTLSSSDGRQRDAAGGGRAGADVQEDGAAEARLAGGVVGDHGGVVVGGDVVHRLRVAARAGALGVYPLVVPGAGGVVVPVVVGIGVPVRERDARAGVDPEEEAEPVGAGRGPAVALALAAGRGDAVVADPGCPRAEDQGLLASDHLVRAERRIASGAGGGSDRDQLAGRGLGGHGGGVRGPGGARLAATVSAVAASRARAVAVLRMSILRVTRESQITSQAGQCRLVRHAVEVLARAPR